MSEFIDPILEFIDSRDFVALRQHLEALPPNEVATQLSRIRDAHTKALIFRSLPRQAATEVFEYLPYEEQSELLESLTNGEVAAVLEEMADDDRTRLFEELPSEVTFRLLSLLSESERQKALELLGYPEGSVGRMMTPHYVRVRPYWSVRKVLDHVREHGKDSETLTMIYVVNERGLLVDEIMMRAFLLAPLDTRVSQLMNNQYVALKATDSQEDAVRAFLDADLPALPVTDTEGALIGVVTIDDILDVVEQEATEDIQKFGGLEALDLPYVQTRSIH